MSREYRFECPLCEQPFGGDDLAAIARRGARHWNEEHGDDLKHRFERIDREERYRHHLHGNEYAVERVDIYLTSFDVMERIGLEDGRLVPQDGDDVCDRCCQTLDGVETVEVAPKDPFDDRVRCGPCDRELEIERRQSQNEQLDAFGGAD